METKHKIEIFTANCPLCDETVKQVRELDCCNCCEILTTDTRQETGLKKARAYGVKKLPAVAIDGRLLRCCSADTFDASELENACS